MRLKSVISGGVHVTSEMTDFCKLARGDNLAAEESLRRRQIAHFAGAADFARRASRRQ